MTSRSTSPGARLRSTWATCSRLPGGRWLFNQALRMIAPYSGAVRNHLNSVHAIALANIAEMASGLAMLSGLPDTVRGIPTAISIQYLKKARGLLTAEARVAIPDVTGDTRYDVTATVKDEAGDEVARATINWKLGLVK